MPQDPNLYGQRPAKRQKKEMAISSSLDFKAQLTSLISKPSSSSSSSAPAASTTSTGKPRPSKSSKSDLFSGVKAKKHSGSSKQASNRDNDNRLVLKDPRGTEDDKAERERARRKMESKARLYAAMQRGDYVPADGEAAPLVDFDRKWAEKHPEEGRGGSASSSDDGDSGDEDNIDNEVIEYEDEFGRLRRGTRADKARMDRRLRARAHGAAELDRMSARPKAPEALIYGDAVQSSAFLAAADDAERRMEELAARRDRSATPPDMQHYDAGREIRTKGVGFYQFSKDEAVRQAEMRSLEAERENTERERREREEKKEARRREVEARRAEIEARRKEIGEKRAKKMADTFLDGLAVDLTGEGEPKGEPIGEPNEAPNE